MPPKNKKGKGKAAAAEVVEENPDMVELRMMRTTAKALSKEIEREAADFNEFQQQREKLNYFWIVAKKELEDKKAELRNKDREIQDLEEKHQVEIKIYKQRLKHLLHEFQDEVTGKKTSVEMSVKLAQDDNRGSEAEVKIDRRSLRIELKETELNHNQFVKGLKQKQDRTISELRHDFERKASEVQRQYEKRMEQARARLEDRRKAECLETEQRKNSHIAHLMETHKRAFAEIKNYYNDITHNNLDLIKSLKEEVAEMRKKEQQDEKQMETVSQENKRMSEPFKKARRDVEMLRAELEKYKKEKSEFRNTKGQLLVVEDELRKLQWEHDIATLRYEELCVQRDDLQGKFQAAVYETQQKTGFKNLILEKKLKSAQNSVGAKEAQLNELLARASLESNATAEVKGRVDDLLQKKNQAVLDMQAELERIKAAEAQLHRAVRGKLEDYGIPYEELGFIPKNAAWVTVGAGRMAEHGQ